VLDLGCVEKNGRSFLVDMIRNMIPNVSLDMAWDMLTAATSFLDIWCDIEVARMFYVGGYMRFFMAASCTFILAQCSYAWIFVVMYEQPDWNDRKRITTLILVLPLARFIPFFIWLQSFHISWVDELMSRLGLDIMPVQDQIGKQQDELWKYIKSKCRSHVGFIAEAFTEAIPQCLLQTAAICLFPELATPMSIYSIFMSVTVVASKAYLISYSPHLETFLVNIACIVADLLNVFATTTWLFAHLAVSNELPLLLHFLLQATCYAVVLACAGLVLLVTHEHLNCRRSGKTCDLVEIYFWAPSFFVLALLPGVVILATLKLGLIPVFLLNSMDEESLASAPFQRALLNLFPAHLPARERERRLHVVNLFTLLADLADAQQSHKKPLQGQTCQAQAWRSECQRLVRAHLHKQESLHSLCSQQACKSMPADARRRLTSLVGLMGPALQSTDSLMEACKQQHEKLSETSAFWDIGCKVCGMLREGHVAGMRELRNKLHEMWCKLASGYRMPSAWTKLDILLAFSMYFASGVILLTSVPCVIYTSAYMVYGLLYPAGQLIIQFGPRTLFHVQQQQQQQQQRQSMMTACVFLSSGFCLSLTLIAALISRVVQHHQRSKHFAWNMRSITAPAGFKQPATVHAMAQLCEGQARQAELGWILRKVGFPQLVTSQIVSFIDTVDLYRD